MTLHNKKQWVVHVKWKKEENSDIEGKKPEYFGPFTASETERDVWMKRFGNVNQGKVESISHYQLVKP